MFITFFMNCLTCIAACLRVHYLISQSACQKMMKCCKWLIIRKKLLFVPVSRLVEVGELVWNYSPKSWGMHQIPHFPTSSDAVLLHLVI